MNVIETAHGRFLVRTGNDLISNHLLQAGRYEWEVVQACALLSGSYESGSIVDVGANIGTVAIPLARFQPKYTVYAYEVQPQVYYQLCGAVALNDLDNVQPHNFGLSDLQSSFAVQMPDYARAPNVGAFSLSALVNEKSPEVQPLQARREMVKMRVMDLQYYPDVVRLIKIDVEGMELEVLRGGYDTIRQHNYPPIVFECWRNYDWYKGKAEVTDKFLTDLGYKLWSSGRMTIALHPGNPLKAEARYKDDGSLDLTVNR